MQKVDDTTVRGVDANALIAIPEFLDSPPKAVGLNAGSAGSCTSFCQVSSCQNCMGTICLSSCQTPAQGGCVNNCDSSCQNCLGCQSCQGCQTACENSAQGPTSTGTITSITSTATTITIEYTSISKAVWYQVVYKLGSSGALQYIANGSSLTCTITGLQPNTTYTVNYRGATATEFGPFMATGKTITTKSNRPPSWSWWSTVSKDSPINISSGEWNAFCTRINEFRDYVGLSQYGAFISVKSGIGISATIVNHAVWSIQSMNSGAKNLEVRPGDIISANFFNGLKNYLNSVS